jgi:hypothetical protein
MEVFVVEDLLLVRNCAFHEQESSSIGVSEQAKS